MSMKSRYTLRKVFYSVENKQTIKWKKIKNIVENISNSIENYRNRGPLTHIHDCSLHLLGRGRVKLV